jgi:hypothetical protein
MRIVAAILFLSMLVGSAAAQQLSFLNWPMRPGKQCDFLVTDIKIKGWGEAHGYRVLASQIPHSGWPLALSKPTLPRGPIMIYLAIDPLFVHTLDLRPGGFFSHRKGPLDGWKQAKFSVTLPRDPRLAGMQMWLQAVLTVGGAGLLIPVGSTNPLQVWVHP